MIAAVVVVVGSGMVVVTVALDARSCVDPVVVPGVSLFGDEQAS